MNKIEQQVMASVGIIYLARKLMSKTALELYVFVCALLGVASLVSLPHIVANFDSVAHGGIPSVETYMFVAVEKTHFVVQAVLLVALFALFSLCRDVVRTWSARTRMATI